MLRLLVCIVLLSFASVSFGQTLSLTETTVVRSKYVFGNGNVVSKKSVVQTDFCVGYGDFWFDGWGSLPLSLSHVGDDYRTELYPTVGWTKKVGDYKLTLYAGFDDLYRTGTIEKTDFMIFAGEVSRDFQVTDSLTLSPFFHVETNFTFDGKVNGDTLLRVGSYFSWKVNNFLSFNGKAYLLYDPGILSNQTAVIGNIEGTPRLMFNDHFYLEVPYLRYVDPLNSVSDGRRGTFVTGFNFVYKF